MLNIRKNAFETNSSSTHSICITKENNYSIPKELYVGFGKFGWEFNEITSPEEKAAYLHTAIVCLCEHRRDELYAMLCDEDIMVTMEVPNKKNIGHIDHYSELTEFIDYVLRKPKNLLNFLFSENSFILTGNDNSYRNVDILVNYSHKEFYKDN